MLVETCIILDSQL